MIKFSLFARVHFGSKSPVADVGAPPSARFHWAVQPFIRGRVSQPVTIPPHLSRAHQSQTPLTQHAPYSLLAVTTRGSLCTKGENNKSANEYQIVRKASSCSSLQHLHEKSLKSEVISEVCAAAARRTKRSKKPETFNVKTGAPNLSVMPTVGV